MSDEVAHTKNPIEESGGDTGEPKVRSAEEMLDAASQVDSAVGGEAMTSVPEAVSEAAPKKEKRARKKKDSQLKNEAANNLGDTSRMAWYIVKVQTNREDSACEALSRRIKVAGMDQYFGQIIVPVERLTEVKGGKKRIVRRKLYPGYIVVQMELNDDTWFLVRETPGIGDFTGAVGRPTPLLPHEVNRILTKLAEEKAEDAPKLKIGCHVGDRVKINEGHFANFQGEVSSIDEANGRITVMINIFGRSTPVELEYWQVEPAE
ncbi:MAG: transcription termination/antitermination protein NusG [Thermogutta sp.]